MGGKKWQGQGNWKQQPAGAQWQSSSSSWQVWPGAWKNKDRSGDGTSRDGHWRDASFPSYQAMQVPVPPAEQCNSGEHGLSEGETPPENGQVDMLKSIQQQLNRSRKVDGKLRKLAADLKQKQGQWAAFQKNLQATYLQERKQYLKDVAGLEKEIGETRLAKEAAMQQLLNLTDPRSSAHVPARQHVQDVPDAEATPGGMREWEALIGAAGHMETESDCALQHALLVAQNPKAFADALARQQAGQPVHQADPWDLLAQTYGSTPATPPSKRPGPYASTPLSRPPPAVRRSGVMPSVVPAPQHDVPAALPLPVSVPVSAPVLQPPYVAGTSPHAASDPYLASPVPHALPKAAPLAAAAAVGTTVGQLPQPLQPMPRAPDRTTFGKAGGRVAVKEATMRKARERSTSHPRPGPVNGPASLAEHVERKRAQALEQQSTIPAHPAGAQQFLIDDDDEPTALSVASNEMD